MSGSQQSTMPKFPGFIKKEQRNIVGQSRGLYDDPANSMLPQLNEWTRKGIGQQADIAQGDTIGRLGIDEASKVLSGGYLDATRNPNFQRDINSAMGMATDRFAGSGRVGSGAYASALGDSAAGVAARMYDQERNRMTDVLGQLPSLITSQYSDASALQNAGMAIDENNLQNFDWPYAKLDRYANTVYGNPMAQNVGQTSKQPFNFLSALGGLTPKIGG